jgi:hypothetical protein
MAAAFVGQEEVSWSSNARWKMSSSVSSGIARSPKCTCRWPVRVRTIAQMTAD